MFSKKFVYFFKRIHVSWVIGINEVYVIRQLAVYIHLHYSQVVCWFFLYFEIQNSASILLKWIQFFQYKINTSKTISVFDVLKACEVLLRCKFIDGSQFLYK